MAAKTFPPEEANPLKTCEPKDPQPAADYRQWISFEGCCTSAPEPPVKRKLPADLNIEGEHSAAPGTHAKSLPGGD